MFSLRKWVRKIAVEAAADVVAVKLDTFAREKSAKPVNIDSELDDGIILLYAREKRLLAVLEWKKKAVKWQEEFETEGMCAGPVTFSPGDTWWPCGRIEKTTPVAVAMRRAILEANVESAEAEKKAADAALKAARKAETTHA